MNFYIDTFGCKVNQYDSQEMAQGLERQGFKRTNSPLDADIVIINSCTVTAESDRKTRNAIQKHRRDKPDSILVLTGCLPQARPDLCSDYSNVDIVTGNRSSDRLPDIITEYLSSCKRVVDITAHKKGDPFTGEGISSFEGHTRAFIKIQDGCDCFCSYCIIPYSRGRSRWKDISKLKDEMAALSDAGYKEIVLVGINLSDYGKGSSLTLADAVFAAEDIKGIHRIRLGSLESNHISHEMLTELKKSSKLCAQFHISLQSGSDRILKAMNRNYTSGEYLELCEKLRIMFHDCTLTTDIMVGFPGETEPDFSLSVDLAKKARFEKIHIFPYSKREGTKAAMSSNQITNAEKKRRAALLAEAADEIRQRAFRLQIGKEHEILVESSAPEGFDGYTRNYFPVKIQGGGFKSGELVRVKIFDINKDYLIGNKINY
ncbi:MAG: tRNA (N(6)-L-threonylcarbamoyladenosine(37)-C(2))-methylthiotransferase MtaB [Acutalibacteraceae bacterium]|jgi:threonylcarbamoyladenosine tRNA methylthiotransferase MtaB